MLWFLAGALGMLRRTCALLCGRCGKPLRTAIGTALQVSRSAWVELRLALSVSSKSLNNSPFKGPVQEALGWIRGYSWPEGLY